MPSYAAPAHLLALCSSDTKAKMTQEVQMKTINLREYYPTIYRRDHLISLPDAVASALHEGKASEVAYQVRVFRNKAYYSLEWAEARGELPTSTAALILKAMPGMKSRASMRSPAVSPARAWTLSRGRSATSTKSMR